MKTIIAIIFSSAVLLTNTVSAVTLPHDHGDTFTQFESTEYSYDAVTDIFTIDMSAAPSTLLSLDGVSYDVFDSRATLTALIDETGYVSSGEIIWYGTAPTIPGFNIGGDKIIEASVTRADYGEFPSWGPGLQFEFNVTNSNVGFGDTGVINLFGLWPDVFSGATPWDTSYSGLDTYTSTDLIFHKVPEPSNIVLLALGLFGMYFIRRRKFEV